MQDNSNRVHSASTARGWLPSF
uniref:Uncharacterized protein n=1 Tax=Arundo donax TaxID=35708 RepID=A0A0A8YFF1_ARUDO